MRSCLLSVIGVFVGLTCFAQSAEKVVKLDSAKVVATPIHKGRGNDYVFSPRQAFQTVSVVGEPDAIRHISSLPGVSQGIEGSLALFVRGANNGSNRIEFDGVPVNSTTHLFGLLSAISPDMISETTFRPGGISARFGDVSSSIIDIKRINGLEQAPRLKFTISPYILGVYGASSMFKGKAGIQIVGRISPFPSMGKAFLKNVQTDFNSGMDGKMYDLNVAIDVKTSENSRADAMFFTTKDDFFYTEDNFSNHIGWGLLTAKLGWTWDVSDKTKIQLKWWYLDSDTFQQQDYHSLYGASLSGLGLSNRKQQTEGSALVRYIINDNWQIESGLSLSHSTYQPSNNRTNPKSDTRYTSHFDAVLYSIFAEMAYKYKWIEGGFGCRTALSKIAEETRRGFDLRAVMDFFLTRKTGIEITADRMTQYNHVVEGLPAGWSVDAVIPAEKTFPEEVTHQGYVGFFYADEFEKSNLNLTTGAYYRYMSGLVSYKTGINMFRLAQNSWEYETATGIGESVGMETTLSYNRPYFQSALSYTLSKTIRQFDEINDGLPFPYKFDRRHILNVQGKYQFAESKGENGAVKRHYFNTVVAYSTGHRETMPISNYLGTFPPYWGTVATYGGDYTMEFNRMMHYRQEMTSMNEYMMPDYFRVDFSYSFEKYTLNHTSVLTLSIFNILNRHNPYLIFVKDGQWRQLSIMPIMPSIRWSIEF